MLLGMLFIAFLIGVIESFYPTVSAEATAQQMCQANNLTLEYYELNQENTFDEIVCRQPKQRVLDDLIYVMGKVD